MAVQEVNWLFIVEKEVIDLHFANTGIYSEAIPDWSL
jgi:hypothetical protein